MYHPAFELSIEQQFRMRIIADDLQKLDEDKLRDVVLELARQLAIKDNLMKALIAGQF